MPDSLTDLYFWVAGMPLSATLAWRKIGGDARLSGIDRT